MWVINDLYACLYVRMYVLVCACIISCVAWPYVAPSLGIPASYRVSKNTAALGASGAINAIVSWSILTFPTRMIYVYMVLPVPAVSQHVPLPWSH
jgi:membrane associated rhomboid family serine protease